MMLEVKELSKRFGGLHALDNCSLKIRSQKITAIIGPNGSGKSTLFNAISALVKKDKGSVKFLDVDCSGFSDVAIAQSGISRTFQEVRLFRNLTIKDHLDIAMSEEDSSLVKSLFRRKDSEDHHDQIKDILKMVQLNKPLGTLATDLSYGQRKLLDLAMAIAKPHKMLMLDEPVAGVNPLLRKSIKETLKQLKEQGETIVVIEHDMNFVMDLADHIIVMDEGRVLVEGTPKQVQNNKKVLEAYLGQ